LEVVTEDTETDHVGNVELLLGLSMNCMARCIAHNTNEWLHTKSRVGCSKSLLIVAIIKDYFIKTVNKN